MVAGTLLLLAIAVILESLQYVEQNMYAEKLHLAAVYRIQGEMSRISSIYQNPYDMNILNSPDPSLKLANLGSAENYICGAGTADYDFTNSSAYAACLTNKTASDGYGTIPSGSSANAYIKDYAVRAIYPNNTQITTQLPYVQNTASSTSCSSLTLTSPNFCTTIVYSPYLVPSNTNNITPDVINSIMEKVLVVNDSDGNTFNYVWLDAENNIAARLSWIVYNIGGTDSNGTYKCLGRSCKILTVFLDYPYRADLKRDQDTLNIPTFTPANEIQPVRTLTLQTIVGYRSN